MAICDIANASQSALPRSNSVPARRNASCVHRRTLTYLNWREDVGCHTWYDQNPPRLCLYLPNTGEWTSAMRLDQTIVPWSILWLFYFEEWLVSNEWKGAGVHPGDEDKDAPNG